MERFIIEIGPAMHWEGDKQVFEETAMLAVWDMQEKYRVQLPLKLNNDGRNYVEAQRFIFCDEPTWVKFRDYKEWIPVAKLAELNAALADPNTPRLTRAWREGRGYSGGHNTAARLDWPTWPAGPVEGAVIQWDATTSGAFTGYYPLTVGLI